MLFQACRAAVDGFTDLSGSPTNRREMYTDVIAAILTLVITITIVAFVGKWFWNNIIVQLFTVTRPATSAWQIIGLILFFNLIK
jgi:hypothetical protein